LVWAAVIGNLFQW